MSLNRKFTDREISIMLLIALICLVILIVLCSSLIWKVTGVQNHCVDKGITYNFGYASSDGECICTYGESKRVWIWNCR